MANDRKYAPVTDGEHYAKPAWFNVDINPKTNNLNLTVFWAMCDKDGNPGCQNADGSEYSIPDGYDGWESARTTYTIAYGAEADALGKCAGKGLDFIKDVAPKTHAAISRILSWCPQWDNNDPFWFFSEAADFKNHVVRVTVVHEEYNGELRASVKYTNPKDRPAKEMKSDIGMDDVQARFGKFFRSSKSAAVSAPAAAPKSAPAVAEAPAPAAPDKKVMTSSKMECWSTYCKKFGSANTEKWYEATESIGKDESDFTAEDWGKVFDAITFTA